MGCFVPSHKSPENTKIHTHAHTHTYTYDTRILVMGVVEIRRKSDNKSVGRREEVGFSFDLRVPDDRSSVLKGSLPESPPAHPWDMENFSVQG